MPEKSTSVNEGATPQQGGDGDLPSQRDLARLTFVLAQQIAQTHQANSQELDRINRLIGRMVIEKAETERFGIAELDDVIRRLTELRNRLAGEVAPPNRHGCDC